MNDNTPCKCVNNHAPITPLHTGHCCFFPATQTCHQTEVAQWENEHANHLIGVRNG